MEQRSLDWFAARLGKVTASRVSDVVAETKSGYAASRANYMAQLICERLTKVAAESYSNAAMEWGTEQEPFARSAYEALQSVLVQEMGFAQHPSIEAAGASPDGLVGDAGLIEIKCPNTATHLDTLLSKKMPAKHRAQVQWQMACTGRHWCDFVSYDPRLPERLKMFLVREIYDPAYVAGLEAEVVKFLGEMENKIKELENL